jgi:hypothetical protein
MAEYKLISTDPVITSTANTTSAVQHFREISAGAGVNIWKVNSEGQFMGATAYSSAPFKVSYQGAVTCSNISITGGTITGATLSGIAAGSMLNIQGWTSTMTFSATDYRTVTWTVGVITLADGTTFNIATGNTGNMAALTYIYFDKAVSTTALQVTTTAATAVGANKILVAVAQNNSDTTSEATLQVFGGSGGLLVKADNIAANTITANEIAANTITAAKMSVTQLSAIAANLGTITAGTITGATIRTALPAADVGSSVVLTGGNDQIIKFYYDATLRGSIKGYTTEGSEVTYIEILAASGRSIKLKNSRTEIDGTLRTNKIYPESDNDYELGDSSNRWSKGHFEDIDCDDLYVGVSADLPGLNEKNLLNKSQLSLYESLAKAEVSDKEIKDKIVNTKDKTLQKYEALDLLKKEKRQLQKETNITGFEIGDVLVWKNGQLEPCSTEEDKDVMAVGSYRGMPCVLGAEPIKVSGIVNHGDYLVSSNIKGCAIAKLSPKTGTVIAQALEEKKTAGEGIIKAMIRKF